MTVTELLTPWPAEALAGLLGVPCPESELPLLWHWVYPLDRPPTAVLGPGGTRRGTRSRCRPVPGVIRPAS